MYWKQALQLTRVHESVFALPWALSAALLPYCSDSYREFANLSALRLLWICLAFVSARTAAMSFNRLIDKDIDAQRPRTQNRLLPSGQVESKQVTVLAWGSVFVFLSACYAINSFCLALAPLAVFLLWAYSYTKRFTALCHFVLGAVMFLAPVMAWAAVTGTASLAPILLGTAIALSIAANDVVYHLQDWSVDKSCGLHSIPIALGPQRSLWLARTCHVLTVVLLWETGVLLNTPPPFYIGVLAIAAILVWHHRLLPADGMGNIPMVFMRSNMLVSLTLFTFTLGSLLWRVMF